MSKPVRIADYLYEQVTRLAAAEKRSTANMVQVLLEQALEERVQEIDDHIHLVGAIQGLSEREPKEKAAEPTSQSRTHRVSRSESCSFDTPRGTKCKACGKVHG